jgi:hypothetical protein
MKPQHSESNSRAGVEKAPIAFLGDFLGEEAVEKSSRYRFQPAKKGVFGLFAIGRVGSDYGCN